MKRCIAIVLLSLLVAAAAGCSSLPTPAPCPGIQRGLAFLNARYNPEIGLLNEAPQAAPNKYWLANDNVLATYTLRQLGKTGLADNIQKTLQRYGYSSNGLIAAVGGATIPFPPYVDRAEQIDKIGASEVWHEFHDRGGRFEDWPTYANLAFLGALNELNLENKAGASAIYASTMEQFDGAGFRDAVYLNSADKKYETYKLALGLYTGAKLKAPLPNGGQMLKALLAMQAANGGFNTHYVDLNTPQGDQNTETTALALLAFKEYGCGGP